MSCDMYSAPKAQELLRGKTIYLFGDSNVRALYKDLIWLLEDGRLIPNTKLKSKNEYSHANDVRLSNGTLHSGRNYKEIRSYTENPCITFHFITRLHLPDFIEAVKNIKQVPDVFAINSCVWDLSRWGSNGVEQFKQNLEKTFSFLKSYLPKTRIIWLTTLPPSFKSKGGFLTKEIAFLRNMLPWHILFANKYASDLAGSFNIDVLDLHYNFRFLLNYHAKDGIHWSPIAMRHVTNLFLTHVALCWNCKLPGKFDLDQTFLTRSQLICNTIGSTLKGTEQKSASNVSHNIAINKKNNVQKKQRRKPKRKSTTFQNFHPLTNRNLMYQQNQGGSYQPQNNGFNHLYNFEPTYNRSIFSNLHQQYNSNIWSVDSPVSNFENGVGQNYQSGYHDPYYASGVQNSFANAQVKGNFDFNFQSQVHASNGGFGNQRSQGRVEKRKSNAMNKNKLEDAFKKWLNM